MASISKSLLLTSIAWLITLFSTVSAIPFRPSRFSTRTYPGSSSTDTLSWAACNASLHLPSNLLCATLSVPINWDAPNGEHFDLGMVKLPQNANSSNPRLGSLFINPGGPGGSAVSTVASIAQGRASAATLRDHFDFIGVDPRGVGLSNAVQCDPAIWNERISQFPQTEDEYKALVDKNKRLGQSCAKLTGPIIDYLDTIQVVKDHEAVRLALGEKFNYLGLSYGTQLGSQYAQLFPDNIRVMVLDGMLQHSQTESSNIIIESTAYAKVLEDFFEWAGNDTESPLKGQNVTALWYELLKNSTDATIPAPGCDNVVCRSDVNEEEIRFNVQNYVLFPRTSNRVFLAGALLEASKGNATLLSSELQSAEDISLYPGIAIGCQDWSAYVSASLAGMMAKQRIGQTYAPLNGGACQSWTLQASCAGWPAPLSNPPAKLNVTTPNTILMVNAIRDPSTSYTWAVGMVEEVKNSVLLTRNGDGHTSWGLAGDTTAAINEYLISLKLPAPGTVLNS